MVSHFPDVAQCFFVVCSHTRIYYVRYKWTNNLPGWISPFLIKLIVLILRSESLNLLTQFWDSRDCCLWRAGMSVLQEPGPVQLGL